MVNPVLPVPRLGNLQPHSWWRMGHTRLELSELWHIPRPEGRYLWPFQYNVPISSQFSVKVINLQGIYKPLYLTRMQWRHECLRQPKAKSSWAPRIVWQAVCAWDKMLATFESKRDKAAEAYGVPFVKILYLTDLAQKLLSLRVFSYLCTHLALSARI